MIPDDAATFLLPLARAAIRQRLGIPAHVPRTPDWAVEPGAAFVTLTLAERLRGCIGSLQPHRSLADDVTHNARAAAFDDPRFAPVTADEEPRLRVEVSVLGAPEAFPVGSRADAAARLRPGVDGLILTAGRHRATFLPQVWDQLGDPDQFLAHLLAKAGLDPRGWPADVALQRYGVTAFEEAG